MAIFGFQLCFTIIMASFLQKLTPMYSFGKWILCGGTLSRYLHPSNDELKKLAGKEAPGKRNSRNTAKRRHQNNKGATEKLKESQAETFKIPKNAPINLDISKISKLDTLVLRKYDDYEWLVDYSLYATIIYIGTEVYYEWWKPAPEFNISMVWALLAIGFVCRNLISIMKLYFKSETGELSICVTFGCFSFVAAMAILVMDEAVLEFGLDSAYKSFSQNTSILTLGITEGEIPTPMSLPVLKIGVASLSGIIGTLIAFPGIRTAQMYVDGLRYSRGSQFTQLLLHVNFATPFLISFMWVKPLARDVLCPILDDPGALQKGLTHGQFDILRIMIIILLCVLKLVSIRTHLQAYLNIAYVKMRSLKREAGHTTNVEIQRTVASVFFYLCIVALQYLAPVVLVWFLALSLKTLGGHSWSQISIHHLVNDQEVQSAHHHTEQVLGEAATFKEMVAHAGVSLSKLSAILTPLVFRSLISFVLWWVCVSWFVASCMGILYHQYLNI